MARRIIKKIGGDRIGSGNKMTVQAHGYGYSTHDVSKVRRTSMTFGTIVPMYQQLMTSGSRLRINLDALITSNALEYQLYGSCKFQLDVFSAPISLYNPKMLINLNDQGYNIKDIQFPLMELRTVGIQGEEDIANQQINPSALLRYLGITSNGQNAIDPELEVTRKHMAMWLLMYYQIGKEYYANKQEKRGVMIHNDTAFLEILEVLATDWDSGPDVVIPESPEEDPVEFSSLTARSITIKLFGSGNAYEMAERILLSARNEGGFWRDIKLIDLFNHFEIQFISTDVFLVGTDRKYDFEARNWRIDETPTTQPRLVEYDLKAIDRMTMAIMREVESNEPLIINSLTELPYGACFRGEESNRAINTVMEGLVVGTYQSDVFNNWLDNTVINNLSNRNKVKVDENGEFSIDMLNLTQKMYNQDMRIGITDGTLEEWREMTYGQKNRARVLKPQYEGGLSKEILFDMVVSTASTADEPLGSIASRGQFGKKHKGGYAQIDAYEETLVMILGKITPRIVYNQGNDWTTNLKTLEDLHKPALDKIGYQNLLTDTMLAAETIVQADGTLITFSAGKQPAWQWYRTNYDDALGNLASTEDYKVFGRSYEAVREQAGSGPYRIKDLTTYIDPMKYNDIFAVKSLDAMNFDVQVGIDARLTLVMSEEVIPGL